MKRLAIFATLLLALLLVPAITAGAAPAARSLLTANSAMPNPAIHRQAIVDELKARLAMIKTTTPALADGYVYETNLGAQTIEEWPTQYQEEDLQTATRVGVFDLIAKRGKENRDSIKSKVEMPVQVRIFHQRGTSPAELRVMIRDVMRAVVTNRATGQEDIQMNNLATDTSPDEEGFIVPRETFQIDGAAVGFTVYYGARPFEA